MKLKVLPILIALLTSGTLLFGGWFMYRSYAMENPLKEIIQQNAGVEQAQVAITNQQVVVSLQLTNGASLRAIDESIRKDGEAYLKGKELKLQITSNSTSELEDWWSNSLFGVAQAMDTKQYAEIPQLLKNEAKTLPGLDVQTEMDSTSVYVRLSDGTHSKYVILPRTPATVGVWPNE
ncbi:hypothetical protein [Gorillibacterium sp. CAU 1737]|uniref:hypothetical protein n=1 Tax=Gorillibacterium sp. CAU 1737 TaxID=3140362 RepID=UPI0032615EA8